jgi:tRNA (guanine37-N1)-methyltransferase
MRVDIITIFPEYFGPLDLSLIGRARAAGLLDIAVHDLRTWTHDVHRTVDDTPYGGGPGMVMRPEPWGEALDALVPAPAVAAGGSDPDLAGAGEAASAGAGNAEPAGAGGAEPAGAGGADAAPARLVVPTPAGERFTQAMANRLAGERHLVFACGRYEGIDQRVLDHAATRMPVSEVSLGDYVLFGGEVAVLVMLEAITRLLPGVLGNAESLADESHAHGLLEAPGYTKPARWRGLDVPDVLRSGDHARIARWRRDQALLRTARRRPDLLARAVAELDDRDLAVLAGAGFRIEQPDMAK